jgi:curved DNA binding protein
MGRGYSANRSATARPANKEKRPRSVSLSRMKDRLNEIATTSKSKEELAKAIQHLDSDDELVASEDEAETVRRPDVMTKYKICGTVTDEAVNTVAAACVVGATTFDLCALGDNLVLEKLGKMFQKSKSDDGKKIKKGLCFPTTVSVNNVLCNHTPFAADKDAVTLLTGDVVKVAVSVHVDGYPTTAARTVVVGATSGSNDTAATPTLREGTANVLAATHFAINGMVRLMKPGMLNQDVTDYIMHVGKCFNVEVVEGVLSNRTKRWILDGNECIIARRILEVDPQQNVGDCIVGEQEVWTLDVAFTDAPTHRLKTIDNDVNIFRRNEVSVQPRNTAAQDALVEIRDTYMCFPFSPLRTEKPLRTRLGILELRQHDMLDQFPVLGSSKGTITARHSCTIAVTDKRVNVLAGAPAQEVPPMVMAAATGRPSAEILELVAEDLLLATAAPKKKGATVAAPKVEDDDNGRQMPQRARKVHRTES